MISQIGKLKLRNSSLIKILKRKNKQFSIFRCIRVVNAQQVITNKQNEKCKQINTNKQLRNKFCRCQSINSVSVCVYARDKL